MNFPRYEEFHLQLDDPSSHERAEPTTVSASLEDQIEGAGKVSVMSIISKLGKKLNVGPMKRKSPSNLGKPRFTIGDNNSFSQSDLKVKRGSRIDQGLSSLGGLDNPWGESHSSLSDTSWIMDSPGDGRNSGDNALSMSTPSHCKLISRLNSNQGRSELPPAFRVSMSSGSRGQQEQPAQNESRPNSFRRKSSRSERTWPPVRSDRPAQRELLASTLSDLRSMSCVKSRIQSFETTAQKKEKEPLRDERRSFQIQRNLSGRELRTSIATSLTSSEEESALILGLPSGKLRHKASLKIRWKGPEIFFIKSVFGDDFICLGDADESESRFHEGITKEIGLNPLIADRFGTQDRDFRPMHPNRPVRASSLTWDEADSENPEQHSESTYPVEPPAVWIAVYERDDGDDSSELEWRVMRVWDNELLDAYENEVVVRDKDLLQTLKSLSHPISSNVEAKTTDQQNNWGVQKVYDIDGEIDFSSSEHSVDELTLLNEIFTIARESKDKDMMLPPNHSDVFDSIPAPPIVEKNDIEAATLSHEGYGTDQKGNELNDELGCHRIENLHIDHSEIPDTVAHCNDKTTGALLVTDTKIHGSEKTGSPISNGNGTNSIAELIGCEWTVGEKTDASEIPKFEPKEDEEIARETSRSELCVGGNKNYEAKPQQLKCTNENAAKEGCHSDNCAKVVQEQASKVSAALAEEGGIVMASKQKKASKKKRKKKRSACRSLFELLSPPPVVTFHST